MAITSSKQPIPSNTLIAHGLVFSIHLTTSFLWSSSILDIPFVNLLLIAALIAWLTLRITASFVTLAILGTLFVRYTIWDASDHWLDLARVTVATCVLLASRVRFCEMILRTRSLFDSQGKPDRSFWRTIRQEGLALMLWLLIAIVYCILASLLIFQTVGSQEEWLKWAQEKRVVLWPHPTLIVLGLLAFLCFQRWQWSMTAREPGRLFLRSEAISILDPDLTRLARKQSAIPPRTKNP